MNPGFRRRVVLAGAALLLAASATSPALAQGAVPGQEVARRLFEEGVALEAQKAYAEALAKFGEAEQIRSTPAIRFHKALCLESLGRLAAALDEYEAAEQAAREQKKAETLRSSQDRLKALRPRVPFLAIRIVSPANAEVVMDGVRLAAPLVASGTRFRTDPGEHQIVARAHDHVTKAQKIVLAPGDEKVVEVTLEKNPPGTVPVGPPPRAPEAAPPAAAPPVGPPTPAPAAKTEERADDDGGALDVAPRRSRVAPVLTTAGSLALIGGGLIAFVVAGGAADDAAKTCPSKPRCDDERSNVRTLDALALAGLVSGVALGGLSAVLWLSGPPKSTSAGAWLRIGPGAVTVGGTL